MSKCFQIRNEALTLDVSAKGAELYALHSAGGPERGWLWDGGEAWGRRAPVCFPWCGRLKDGFFEESGTRYEAGIHGLLRDMEHVVLAQTGDAITLRAESDAWSQERYPWRFWTDTAHALVGNQVRTTVTVTNLDERAMPVQIGFHTGFRCPFTPQRAPEDYLLRFEQEEEPLEALCIGGLISGETRGVFTRQSVVGITSHMFDEDSICLTGLKSKWVQLEERDSGRALRVGIENYPCVLLWSAPGMPGFLCIEPWQGMPSRADGGHTLWERPSTVRVEPGQSFAAVQTMELIEN